MRPEPPVAPAETISLEKALNAALSSLDSRMDPINRAIAAGRVAEKLNNAQAAIAQRRSQAVASAVMLPGMSMAKVADELGVSKSMVAKMAGPADIRDQIAADMRARLAGKSPASSAVDLRLQAAFGNGASEGRLRRR